MEQSKGSIYILTTLRLLTIVDTSSQIKLVEKLSFCDNLEAFYLSTHKTENCLRTADDTHRSEFFMRTQRKIVRTYAVRIVIYIAGQNLETS